MITHHASRITLRLAICLLTSALCPLAVAVEDPPNCDVVNGGLGNTSVGGVNFLFGQAHLGDTVALFPKLGMVVGACSASGATGTLYIATGALTNFMVNVTLDPTGFHSCPSADPLCEAGPYNLLITAPLVGAGVTSPNGNVSGVAKTVRAVENGTGTVNTGAGTPLNDFHSASITIVTPCIEVFKTCLTNCAGNPVEFTGYVTNCGDITLTNVTLVDDRTASLYNLDNSSLSQPFTLTNGAVVPFKGSFTATPGVEITTATNTITATGTDTTTIGGPYASVTNTVTAVGYITACANCQCPCLIMDQPITRQRYATR